MRYKFNLFRRLLPRSANLGPRIIYKYISVVENSMLSLHRKDYALESIPSFIHHGQFH